MSFLKPLIEWHIELGDFFVKLPFQLLQSLVFGFRQRISCLLGSLLDLNQDLRQFDTRYWQNPVAERLEQSLRFQPFQKLVRPMLQRHIDRLTDRFAADRDYEQEDKSNVNVTNHVADPFRFLFIHETDFL